MIPVTVQTPDASYSINGTDYIFSPALPGAIRFIIEVYQEGGFT